MRNTRQTQTSTSTTRKRGGRLVRIITTRSNDSRWFRPVNDFDGTELAQPKRSKP
jgi:hypothetical protein